jgi:hypothetical protein
VSIVARPGARLVLLITELADNPSTSITTMMEQLAPEIIREFLLTPLLCPPAALTYLPSMGSIAFRSLHTEQHAAPLTITVGGEEVCASWHDIEGLRAARRTDYRCADASRPAETG